MTIENGYFEIKGQDTNSQPPVPPLARWYLDDLQGLDSSEMGHGFDGVMDSTVYGATEGPYGVPAQGVVFPPSTMLDLGVNITDIDLTSTYEWSFSAWIKTPTVTSNRHIFGRSNVSVSAGSSVLYVESGTGYLAWWSNGVAAAVANVAPTDLRDSDWHFVSVDYRYGKMHLMVDGLVEFSGAVTLVDTTSYTLFLGAVSASPVTDVSIFDAQFKYL